MTVQVTSKTLKLTHQITDEIFKALGLSTEVWWRKFVTPWVNRPSAAFAKIVAEFDDDVLKYDFTEAARRILPYFVKNVRVSGADLIPDKGPLLITSNHPGTYDSLVIAANLPRKDLKILAGNIPFLQNLPATQRHIIHTTIDTHDRMTVCRRILRHLKTGGSLLIFGSGGIDPEPAYMPGADAEIEKWSPSIEFFMKKVPHTQVLVTIVSNVLAPHFIRHPLTRIRKLRRDKQRISEFIQVVQQMLSPGKILLNPQVSFAKPISMIEIISRGDSSKPLDSLIERAKQLLQDHMVSVPSRFINSMS